MMRLAIITPTAAPKGISPKQGPTPRSSPMKSPKVGLSMLGPIGDISQNTYPKYHVVRQSTTTLP